jgi:CheY-like chemotaxis protein
VSEDPGSDHPDGSGRDDGHDQPRGAAPCVLVVEDDPDLANIVEINLEHEGYRVEHAPEGRTGLARTRELTPDLVLLDVMMPLMDGWEVLREIKSDERTRDIPVVMLTALAEEHRVDERERRFAINRPPCFREPPGC